MLTRIINKLKSINYTFSKIHRIVDQLNHLQQANELSQHQLLQLQSSVDILEKQQEWFRKKVLTHTVHTYPDDPIPTFEKVTSQLCTYEQMLHPNYARWCKEIEKSEFLKSLFPDKRHESLSQVPHRKIWEFCYILQALEDAALLEPDRKGLGFGVGSEPLPALFAHYGCKITATDMSIEEAVEQGWAGNAQLLQHSKQLEDLNKDGICNPDVFLKNCAFRVVDMNKIPKDLTGFDFVWSACCLEHLGSIQAGEQFIRNSLDCLRSGGLAIHTTEFNLTSDVETVDNHHTVLYRRRDIVRLIKRLEMEGYQVAAVTFNAGTCVADEFVDVPPYYKHNFHLKLLLGDYVTTSIGIIIRKP